MAGLIQQLGNEQLLLMYLAGELPPQDAADLEMMLRSDARLAAELQSLEQARTDVFSTMERLDRLEASPVGERNVVCEIHRLWNLQPVASPVRLVPVIWRLRYPWWAYPTATAAAILLAFLVWWGNSSYSPSWVSSRSRPAAGVVAERSPREAGGPWWRDQDPWQLATFRQQRQQWLAQWLATSLGGAGSHGDDIVDDSLDRAEHQVAMLTTYENSDAFPFTGVMESNPQ